MAPRKKKKRPEHVDGARREQDEGTSGLGSLAEAIGDTLRQQGRLPDGGGPRAARKHRRRLERSLEELRERAARNNAPDTKPETSGASPAPPRTVSPEEAMALAFDAMEKGALHAHKFSGEGTHLEPTLRIAKPDVPEETDAPLSGEPAASAGPTEEERLFLEAVGDDIRPMDQRLIDLQERGFVGTRWPTEHQLETLSAVDLHEAELTSAQRRMLRRSRRGNARLPELNIRHLRRREALAQVAAFVHTQRQAAQRHVRIITGKGRHSAEEPVLKRAVIEWIRTEGHPLILDMAPETDRSGRYGSLVLELRAPERRP